PGPPPDRAGQRGVLRRSLGRAGGGRPRAGDDGQVPRPRRRRAPQAPRHPGGHVRRPRPRRHAVARGGHGARREEVHRRAPEVAVDGPRPPPESLTGRPMLRLTVLLLLVTAPAVRADEAAARAALEKRGAQMLRDDKAPGAPVLALRLAFQ